MRHHLKATRIRRRGTAAVAVLIVLILVGLFVVGIVNTGARDQDLSAKRLATVQAFYAAEGGINMAMRELVLTSDEDADGAIGSISDDGSNATDPAIGAGRVAVTITSAAGQDTLVSSGRSANSQREITATVQ